MNWVYIELCNAQTREHNGYNRSTKFNLSKAKDVTKNLQAYYVFADDAGEKFIICHADSAGQIDKRVNSAIGTFPSATLICCFPACARDAGYNVHSQLTWKTETTFCYDGETLYITSVE